MRRRGFRWTWWVLGAVLVATHGPVPADEGRVPLFQPATFNGVSGKFIVTRDITLATTGAVLTFNGTGTELVDIDLNGFTISGIDGSAVIEATALKKIRVHNGTIKGSPTINGISATACKLSIAEDLTIDNAYDGIWFSEVRQFLIRRNAIGNTTLHGIAVAGTAADTSVGTIEDNLIQDTDDDAIIAIGSIDGVTFRRNKVRNTGPVNWFSIIAFADAVEVVENTIEDSRGTGLYVLGNTCRIADNVITNSVDYGLQLNSNAAQISCVIEHNVVTGNGAGGMNIWQVGGNLIDSNVLNDNGGYGIRFHDSSDNGYLNNTMVGNTSGCIANVGTSAGNIAIGPNHCF